MNILRKIYLLIAENLRNAFALKKLDERKNFMEVNGSDYLNLIFNESIENVEKMKLKNRNKSYIIIFFRSQNIFYLYCLLVSYEKNPAS